MNNIAVKNIEMKDRMEWEDYQKEIDAAVQKTTDCFLHNSSADPEQYGFPAEIERALFKAIDHCDEKMLEQVCTENHISLSEGNSYMLKHIVIDAPKLTKKALELGAIASDEQSAAYRMAVELGFYTAAGILLSHGADSMAIEKYGHTTLWRMS